MTSFSQSLHKDRHNLFPTKQVCLNGKRSQYEPSITPRLFNPYTLNQFLRLHYISSNSKIYCNYISQTGGRYFIENNYIPRLFNEIQKSVKENKPFSLIENVDKTNHFKLFFDIEDDNTPLPSTKDIVKTITDKLKSLTPQDFLDYTYISFVNLAKHRHRRHIIFQKIWVDLDTYKLILKELPNYIDKSVHSLRLPFSHKVNNGKFDANAGVYFPEEIFKSIRKGKTIIYKENFDVMYYLRLGSIFIESGDPNKSYKFFIREELKTPLQKKRKNGRLSVIPELTTKTQQSIQNLFNKHPELYENFNLEFNGDNILLRRLQPSECIICEREHDNIDLYMFIQNGKLYLKCWRNIDGVKLLIGAI